LLDIRPRPTKKRIREKAEKYIIIKEQKFRISLDLVNRGDLTNILIRRRC
jgi:hypothetical protein